MLYRFYFVDARNQISGPPKEIDCMDDDDAVEAAHGLVDGQTIEIWDRARLIGRVEARDGGDGVD